MDTTVNCFGCNRELDQTSKSTRTANKLACDEFLTSCRDPETRDKVFGYYDPKETQPICWDCANALGQLMSKEGYKVSIRYSQVADDSAKNFKPQAPRAPSTTCTGCKKLVLIRDARAISGQFFDGIDFKLLSRLEVSHLNSIFSRKESLPICAQCAHEVASIFKMKVEVVSQPYVRS